MLEHIYKHWDQEEGADEFEGEYQKKIIQLIIEYYSDYIYIKEIIEKPFQTGSHNVIEGLFLEKLDNLIYYLDITLDKLQHKYLNGDYICFDTGHGKILMLILPSINYNLIDLNGVMNDLFHIGHSPAIMWLLENKSAYFYDMTHFMNEACFNADLKLVKYLYKQYNKEDFDYKTAMIKACRNSEEETLDVCKWLWKKNDHIVFDMTAALHNASKYDNTEVVEWILTDVDKRLFDTKPALFDACEHGEYHTVKLLLDASCINILDFQHAIITACLNETKGVCIAEFLYSRADQSTIDLNAVFLFACKNYRSDIMARIIETGNQNITVVETSDGNKHFIKRLDKNLIDINNTIDCILDMDTPEEEKDYVDEIKIEFLMLILNKSDPSIIHFYKLLIEVCTNDWVYIFQWILEKVDHASLNIRENINVACRFGAFNIVKWSLKNIDIQFLDADIVMIESCGFGWLECLVLIWQHCDQYKMQASMTEACTYGRLHIAEWLLQNVPYQLFNIPMLLQEAGRNGWIKIFGSLLHHSKFDKRDMHIATRQALENGHLEIAELVISTVGKDCFSFSSLSENTYMGANKEGVVNFILHNIDPKGIDIATIMTNACLFGWKAVATFIVDNDLTSLCDISLAFNTACDNGELEIVQLLLDKVDPHILTTLDKAMHSVAVKGLDEIAVLLLDKIEHTRLDIGNAFIEACRHGEIDVVQEILQKVDTTMLDVKAALDKACEKTICTKNLSC